MLYTYVRTCMCMCACIHVCLYMCSCTHPLQDLEIAADFKIKIDIPELFGILKASDHVRVIVPHQKLDKMIFVPEGTSENPKCVCGCRGRYRGMGGWVGGCGYIRMCGVGVMSKCVRVCACVPIYI